MADKPRPKLPRLMSPAGDLEKLRFAVLFGADGVYLAGKSFGMRARSANFTPDELAQGIDFAHGHGASVHVAINIAARDAEIPEMVSFAKQAYAMGADGFIVADPGLVFSLSEALPDAHLTLSTQANTTNAASLAFWARAGVKRVVLARELGRSELEAISADRPKGMELEVFVHGAMCVSYSGRCLLSNYLTGRDSNRGECAQPCRWAYSLVEKSRQGEHFDIVQTGGETHILNSKDLCLIARVKELAAIGIDWFKIEGRVKSSYYAAATAAAYARAIGRVGDEQYEWEDLYAQLLKVSHRPYTEAFYPETGRSFQENSTTEYERDWTFIGVVKGSSDGLVTIEMRNRFAVGERLQALSPKGEEVDFTVLQMSDENNIELSEAIIPMQLVSARTDIPLPPDSLIRAMRD